MKRAYGLRNAIALAPKLSLNALKANIASLKNKLAAGQGSAAQKTEARAIIRVLEKARKSLIEVMGKEVAAEYVKRYGPLKKNPAVTKRFPFKHAGGSRDAMPYRIGKNDEIYHMPGKGVDPRDYEGVVALKRMLQGGEKVKAPWSKGTKKLPSGVVDGRPSSYRKNGKRKPNPLTRRAFMASKAYGKSTAAMSMLEKAALHPGEWLHIPNKPHFNQPARELRHEGRNVQKSEVKGCLYKIKFR